MADGRDTRPAYRSTALDAWVPWIRLLTGGIVAVGVFLLLAKRQSPVMAALIGWDAGITVLMGWLLHTISDSAPDTMRRRAATQDLGRSVILGVVVGGAIFSLLALAFIQKTLKDSHPPNLLPYLATIVATILLSWLLVHTMFALHYAHRYYGAAEDENDEDGLVGGLEFPEEKQPDYWDFLYFSFVVGMTCQVSDVQITGRRMRRLALMHGVISFFFNTIILALTINIVAGII